MTLLTERYANKIQVCFPVSTAWFSPGPSLRLALPKEIFLLRKDVKKGLTVPSLMG